MAMEVETGGSQKVGVFASGWLRIKGLAQNLAAQTEKTARDDPRRLIHSLKVALGLTIVSLFYYFQPLYRSFGESTMWAIMTVIIVFEFSVGATLGKGLNRGLATLVAGGLGLGAHYVAVGTGKTCEPILIGLFVFLQAAASTFIRFFPQVKARYDYGMLVFILTFSLVTISGLQTDEILRLAQQRVLTILTGASTCVIISIFVYPVWAGEDLHKLVAQNINKLGDFLEGFGDECVKTSEQLEKGRWSCLVGLNSVVDSKSREETLANFARWEPGHGRFMCRHPWKQYLKIANLTRQCASRVEALKGYLNSETQVPQEIQVIISGMSSESGKALKKVAWAVETMTKPSRYRDSHVSNLKIASKNLNSLLKSDLWEEQTNLLEVIPVAAVASLLNDTVTIVEMIADAVDELGEMANFTNGIEGEEGKNDKSIPLDEIVIDGTGEVKKEGQSLSVQVG